MSVRALKPVLLLSLLSLSACALDSSAARAKPRSRFRVGGGLGDVVADVDGVAARDRAAGDFQRIEAAFDVSEQAPLSFGLRLERYGSRGALFGTSRAETRSFDAFLFAEPELLPNTARFRAPMRFGLFVSDFDLQANDGSGDELNHLSFGLVRLESHPELTVARSGEFECCLFGAGSVTLATADRHATGRFRDQTSADADLQAGLAFGYEVGARLYWRHAIIGASYLGRGLRGFGTPTFASDFTGVVLSVGVRW